MRPTSSPWGKIDYCKSLSSVKDVYEVGTPGHGGLMMPPEDATRLKISKFGEIHRTKSSGWICFEEDCQIAVAILALMLTSEFPFNEEKAKDVLFSVRSWNYEYFESVNFNEFGEIGQKIKQIADSLDFHNVDKNRTLREKRETMRVEKSPDLIVSASGLNNYPDLIMHLRLPRDIREQEELAQNREILRALQNEVDFFIKDEEALFSEPGVVLVTTAEGSRHLVRNYDSSRDLNLLSECVKIGIFK